MELFADKMSLAVLLSQEPQVLNQLVDHLLGKQKKGLETAAELIEKIYFYCKPMFCEPKWRMSSKRQKIFWTRVYFWEAYQNILKNVEAYIIQDLTLALDRMHGPMMDKLVHQIENEIDLKKTGVWGNEPGQYWYEAFDVYHVRYTALMSKFVDEVPNVYSIYLKQKEIQVGSTLYTSKPTHYSVEFVMEPAQRRRLFFCVTSNFKFPRELPTSKGIILFNPHTCQTCINIPAIYPGLKHMYSQ